MILHLPDDEEDCGLISGDEIDLVASGDEIDWNTPSDETETHASPVGWEDVSNFPSVGTHWVTSLDCKTESGVLLSSTDRVESATAVEGFLSFLETMG